MRANHALNGLVFLNFLGACYATEQPEFRPALIGTGRRALVNLIDTNSLIKQGQGNAMVMFSCLVVPSGGVGQSLAYGGTPGSEALTKELLGKIGRASFIPAIYHHTPQAVVITGTVVFVVTQGKPHLAIYLNQELDDLTRGNDFVAPRFFVCSGQSSRALITLGREGEFPERLR